MSLKEQTRERWLEEQLPENCIMCHRPRLASGGMAGSLQPNKLSEASPFCNACFVSTNAYFRERLVYARRSALALESLAFNFEVSLAELAAVAELIRKFSPVLINVQPDESGELLQGT